MSQHDEKKTLCGKCKYFRVNINPETNQPRWRRQGTCGYEVEWPKVPYAFIYYQYDGVILPKRRGVFATDGSYHQTDKGIQNCPCFEAKKKGGVKDEEVKA